MSTKPREQIVRFWNEVYADNSDSLVPLDGRLVDEAISSFQLAELRRQRIEMSGWWLMGFLWGVVAGCAVCRLYDWITR